MCVITMLHASLLQRCFHSNVQDVVVITKSGVWALASQAQESVASAQWSATQASSVVGPLVQSSRLHSRSARFKAHLHNLPYSDNSKAVNYSNNFLNHLMPKECLSPKSRTFKSNPKATKSSPKRTHTLKPSKHRWLTWPTP